MGNGTADGAGKGESGVEIDTGHLLRHGDSGDLLDDGVDLGRSGCCASHCDWEAEEGVKGLSRVWSRDGQADVKTGWLAKEQGGGGGSN